jgi:TolB protein
MRFLFGGRFRVVALLVVALAGVAAVSAAASPPGTNGQITFARSNPTLGDTQVYVVNPDGSGERLVQGPTDVGEVPQWYADGAHIATSCD